ncbi:MAG: glycoside hydrolase family 28 protein [Phycisphaerae bacterium]
MAVRAAVVTALIATATFAAAAAPPAVQRPKIPGRIFAITDFGAVGDHQTPCGDAIKQAVSAASKAGGGVVLVPAGEAGGNTFLTGPVSLTSNIELRVEKGATLLFSPNPEDFPVHTSRHADLLTARGCHDFAITGEGVINGSGEPWWKGYSKSSSQPRRPFMFDISNSQRVLLENITIANSPSTAVVLAGCRDVTVDHIRASAPEDSPNTDGLAISGHNFAITHSTFDVGEEDIVINPTGDGSPEKPECSNIAITDCTIQHGKGILVGNQTSGCLRDLSVSNCTFEYTQYGIRLRSERGRGGTCEHLAYDNIKMHDVKYPIWFASYFPIIPKNAMSDKPAAVTASTPVWKDIRVTNFSATGALSAGSIVGLPEQPIDNVTLTHIKIGASKPMEIAHAKGIVFSDAHLTAKSGKPVVTGDAEVTGIDTVSSKGSGTGAGESLP